MLMLEDAAPGPDRPDDILALAMVKRRTAVSGRARALQNHGGDAAGTTSSGPDGLSPSDPGLLAMAELVANVPPDSLLLAYCGDCDALGPAARRLVLDVRESSDKRNHIVEIQADRWAAVGGGELATAALLWPRPHLGKAFTLSCFAEAGLRLKAGGQLFCAAKKAKGAKSLAEGLHRLFGAVETVQRHRGYHIFRAVRGPEFDEVLAETWLRESCEIQAPELGSLTLYSQPGVFSWRELDRGTAALCRVVESVAQGQGLGLPPEFFIGQPPKRVLDLCCGIAPLACVAARAWPQAEVLAIDSNYLAVALARANADANGIGARLHTVTDDGLSAAAMAAGEASGHYRQTDLALVNPPTHAPEPQLRAMIAELFRWLAPRGRALLVVKRHGTLLAIADILGLKATMAEVGGYAVICLRR